MGYTRDFLNKVNGLIAAHRIGQNDLVSKYCANPNLEDYYRHQIVAFDQKLESTLRKMVDDHIHYLEAKDPYGRQPLNGAIAKKNLFVEMRSKLKSVEGNNYIKALATETEKLLANPLIDQPRWPKLNLDTMYHFFKSVFSNPSAYLDKITNLDSNRKSSPKKRH